MKLGGRISFSIVQIWLITIGLLAIAFQFSWWWTSRKLIEAFLYLLLCIFLFTVSEIKHYFAQMPKPHQWVLIAFVILLFVCQIVNQPRLTFPIVSWAMYGRPEHPATLTYYRYEGKNRNKATVYISPEELLATINESTLASKLRVLVPAAISSRDDLERENNLQILKEFFMSVGEIYNRTHPEEPISTLQIIEYSIDLSHFGTNEIKNRPVFSIELEYAS